LPKGVSFKGVASFGCDVQIDGTFEGDLVASQGSSATISAGATFTGNITATNITIDGHAHGSVDASAGVARFGAASICTGNVLYGRLAIAEGAEIEATTKKARAQ
jgi:cytoskeletal protein CcmA (bactofilin family)